MRITALLVVILLIIAGCETNTDITVMTYNIHHAEGTDGKLDLDRIASVIKHTGADLVGLNEVDNNFGPRSNYNDQAKILAESLNMHYVFGPALKSGSPGNPNLYGNAILSRFPITHSANHPLITDPGHEPRACIAATITIGGDDYTFIATHLDNVKTEMRVKQAQNIIAIIENIDTPVILAGDFNCPPPDANKTEQSSQTSRPVAIILEKLESSFAIAGIGPANTIGSTTKIDYIFVSPDLADKVKNATVIRTDQTATASDHLPMIAEFKL